MPSSINKVLRDRGLAPDEVTLHLKYAEKEALIHCMYCCKGLFKQHARIVSVFMAGEPDQSVIMSIPISVQCPRCGVIHHLSTLNR